MSSEPGRWRGVPASPPRSSRRRVILLGVWIVYPVDLHDLAELLRPLGRQLHLVRQLPDALHDRHDPHGDQEQRDLGRRRAGARDRDRARLRRADRAHPLVGRVQDRRLHADGGVALRRRRDLAHHVPAGAVAGRASTRSIGVGRTTRSSRRGRSRTRCPSGTNADGHAADGHRAQDAASGRAASALLRADRHPARPGAGGLRAGQSQPTPKAGRDHRRRLARLQAGRRHAGQGRAGRGRAPGRDGRAASTRRARRSASTTTAANGTFAFTGVEAGHLQGRRSARPRSGKPYGGVAWLGAEADHARRS